MSHPSTQPSDREDYRANPESLAKEAEAIRISATLGPKRPTITAAEARAENDKLRKLRKENN